MERTKEAEQLLRYLGVNGAYLGLKQTAYAVALAMENRGRLDHITKGMYREIAKEFQTGWKNIEANIRTVIDVIWMYGEQEALVEISGGRLDHKPTNTEFLNILAVYLHAWEKDWAAIREWAVSRELDTRDGGPSRYLMPLHDSQSRRLILWLIKRIRDLEDEIDYLKGDGGQGRG